MDRFGFLPVILWSSKLIREADLAKGGRHTCALACCELRRQLYDNNLHTDMRKSVNLA